MSDDLPAAVDVIVIGGGPAGLSAATWLGQYQRSTLVIDAGQQRNLAADEIHGMLGPGPNTPRRFYTDARDSLKRYAHVQLHNGTVTALRQRSSDDFVVTVDGAKVRAKRIVLATGVRDRLPQVEGIENHYGTDVHHCAACDGYAARGRTVIVLSNGEQAAAYASELLDWAAKVRVVTETAGDPLFGEQQRNVCAEHDIEVVDGIAQALMGDPGALTGVRLADGRVVEGDKVFFSYAHQPTNNLAQQLGCELDHESAIVVDAMQLSSVDGVYAAGDITAGLQLIPIAVGKGAAAGVACATSLRGHSTTCAAPDPAPPAQQFTGS